MSELFHTILVEPLLNLMVLFYNIIPDVGVSIILITIIVRILLLPSFNKSLRSQKALAELQPKLNEIREKYSNNKEEQAKAMMELYRDHKVSPFSSCLPLLIQLPLLFALYRVFMIGLGTDELNQYLYSFVSNPGHLNPMFVGLVDLSKANVIFGVVAGIAQFLQSKMMLRSTPQSKDPTMKALAIQTVYVLPALTVLISIKLPAGLPLYWIVTTLFAIGQQYYIIRNNKQAQVN